MACPFWPVILIPLLLAALNLALTFPCVGQDHATPSTTAGSVLVSAVSAGCVFGLSTSLGGGVTATSVGAGAGDVRLNASKLYGSRIALGSVSTGVTAGSAADGEAVFEGGVVSEVD